MERGRESEACPSGELQEGGSRDRPAEGPEDEGWGPGALRINSHILIIPVHL